MKVGEFIYQNINIFIDICKKGPSEFDKLLSIPESKKLFDLNYAFFIEKGNIDDNDRKRSSARYKADIYRVFNREVRVTNDWYERNIPYIKQYLIDRNINIPFENNIKQGKNTTKKTNSKKTNSRYKGNAIGNAQNSFIRNILSNLGNESFTENDWKETKSYFKNKCAYCGKAGELVMEHAIPINKEKLGEHKLGNIVPACEQCNKNKANKNYREYLGNNLEAIKNIDRYMENRNYKPLEDDEQFKCILKLAHEEVPIIANRYIKLLNELFIENKNEK
jgi:hypothetical protein